MAGQRDTTAGADLLARFAAGDESGVRAFYDRWAGPIFTVAMSMLGKRELADEALQVTMLKAWRGAATFDPTRDPAPWLYTIARRVAVDIYRRESRADQPTELADDQVTALPPSFERTWEAWEIRAALDRLPEDERAVVRLSHQVGMTHREIAEHLGVPIGTVKSRSSRAHRRLAQLLAHLLEVEP